MSAREMQHDDGKLVFSVQEAARVLGLSRNKTYEAVMRGEIPSVRFGRRILIPKWALVRMLDRAAEESVAPLRRGR